jgi:cytochrome P450
MFDAAFIANPYPTYSILRSGAPIHWSNDFSGGAWLLPRYTDVANALRDPRLSARRSHMLMAQFSPETREEFTAFSRILAQWMVFLDSPQHSRLRRLMNQGFKPGILQAMRPRIQRAVDALLERVQEAGQMDFMLNFAHPLPALVIAEMLGIDSADQADFLTWSDAIAAFIGNPQSTLEVAHCAQTSLIALIEYFRTLLPERRRHRGDDLISLLIYVEEEGEVLTAEELLAQCSMLLFAGHETTRNLLGNGLWALLQHPDQLTTLKNNPSLMPQALRELVRYESPLQCVSRLVADDFSLHGHHLEQGQRVILLIGSANRDPDKFANPDILDISRKDGTPLSFGYGAHVCIGATISYLEAEIAFNTLFARMPHLQLADDTPVWCCNVAFRGLARLPLVF